MMKCINRVNWKRAIVCVAVASCAIMMGTRPNTRPSGGSFANSQSGPSHKVEDDTSVWTAGVGDSVARLTDSSGYQPPEELPVLRRIMISGWTPTAGDPFAGSVTPGDSAHVMRMDIEFTGLVNPPGTIGLNGLPFNPHVFGPNPLFGFVEIDIDGDIDTGGVLGAAVHHRYLSNIARFGGVPNGPTSARAARWKADRDTAFTVPPYIERSGADFELVLDGLRSVTVLEVNGGAYRGTHLSPGDTWLIEGRFFQRSSGYQDASKAYNGSDDGLYDPIVTLQFRHEIDTERDTGGVTTVTLVYALDMIGAAMMAGEGAAVQEVNHDVSDHTSIEEAMRDIVDSVEARPLGGPAGTLANGWAWKNVQSHLDPTQWRLTAIFGGAYSVPSSGRYIYSSVGFDMLPGDVDGDGRVDEQDGALIQGVINSLDGTAADAGDADGSVQITNFASNFSVYDVTGDGVIDEADIEAVTPSVLGDLNGDGLVNAQDLGILLGSWGVCPPAPQGCPADINGDGVVNAHDLAILLGSWG